jgi:hypothetical protein
MSRVCIPFDDDFFSCVAHVLYHLCLSGSCLEAYQCVSLGLDTGIDRDTLLEI